MRRMVTLIMIRMIPPIPEEVNHLIDNNAFAIVLCRIKDENKLLLLVNGLESQRTDNRNRKIRNSIVCVGDSSEEKFFLNLTIEALSDKLSSTINAIVTKEDQGGFFVEKNELKEFLNQHSEGGQKKQKEVPKEHLYQKFGNLDKKPKLADELLTLGSLPNKDSLLVVVTGVSKKQHLQKYKIC